MDNCFFDRLNKGFIAVGAGYVFGFEWAMGEYRCLQVEVSSRDQKTLDQFQSKEESSLSVFCSLLWFCGS